MDTSKATRSVAATLLMMAVLVGLAGPAAGQRNFESCLDGNLEPQQDATKDLRVKGPCTVGKGTYTFKNVHIYDGGVLTFTDADIAFTAASIEIDNTGSLLAGTKDAPIGIAGQLTITFVGSRPNTCELVDEVDAHHDWCGKGILVSPGGTLKLFGAKGAAASGVNWTHLAAAAGPSIPGAKVQSAGAKTLTLARDVTQGPGRWKKDDWVAVATTSFSPFETEFVQLASDATLDVDKTSKVELVQSLKYYHFGGLDPGHPSSDNYNGAKSKAEYNYGVDERAEVGLITRSIKLTAAVDAAEPHWGGEIKLLKGFAEVVLQGVEIENFGKERLGAYPVHLHQLGSVAANTLTIDGNSIHHSFNKCITIHSTQNVTIQNNVCARIIGHIFYQEIGDEANITFQGNLGLGAMSHYFDIHDAPNGKTRQALIDEYWWIGDNLAGAIGYDGFNVINTDAQTNPTRGACSIVDPSREGGLTFQQNVPCAAGQYYVEPASGFWIVNPGTKLIGNSIGGCQGVGRAYWYVPPKDFNARSAGFPALADLKWTSLGEFRDNRAHGCFGGLFAEDEYTVRSEQLFPRVGGTQEGQSKFAVFDSFTATRNRDRGVWVRPAWYVVTNARLATNKHSISLVTSGGVDGNAPGVWSLLAESVVVGVSQNNVDRFGPCPKGNPTGLPSTFGCIDQTRIAQDKPLKGADEIGRGYPDFTNGKNLFGYMIYDGPARIFNNRFVNFLVNVKPELTQADQDALGGFEYEGDAALGWFNSNPSSYPTATASSGLIFENVTLRHQVFTEKVNTGTFADGDKNTAIIDLDGSLGGYEVVDANGQTVKGAFAISLNNLPFNATGNAVAECLALGNQDRTHEQGRPTALMSPASTASLEFSALYPHPPETDTGWGTNSLKTCISQHWQVLTFTKDSKDFGVHQSMELFSRNGLGIWEPKVASGHGYTVTAKPGKPQAAGPPAWCPAGGTHAGIPNVLTVGVADVVKPNISATNPFWIRLGICYKTSDTSHSPPAEGAFTIQRGYKSYAGGNFQNTDPGLRKFFNHLDNRYKQQTCINLNDQQRASNGLSRNLLPDTGCPADGVTPTSDGTASGTCPAGADKEDDQQSLPACIFKKTTLHAAKDISELMVGDQPMLDTYFYDKERGWLFLNVAQEFPNAHGPSPLADCPGHAACPDLAAGESYYTCPPQGCLDYTIRVNDPNYVPGESKCGDPYGPYEQERPVGDFRLAYKGTPPLEEVKATAAGTATFPYYVPSKEPVCPVTSE